MGAGALGLCVGLPGGWAAESRGTNGDQTGRPVLVGDCGLISVRVNTPRNLVMTFCRRIHDPGTQDFAGMLSRQAACQNIWLLIQRGPEHCCERGSQGVCAVSAADTSPAIAETGGTNKGWRGVDFALCSVLILGPHSSNVTATVHKVRGIVQGSGDSWCCLLWKQDTVRGGREGLGGLTLFIRPGMYQASQLCHGRNRTMWYLLQAALQQGWWTLPCTVLCCCWAECSTGAAGGCAALMHRGDGVPHNVQGQSCMPGTRVYRLQLMCRWHEVSRMHSLYVSVKSVRGTFVALVLAAELESICLSRLMHQLATVDL